MGSPSIPDPLPPPAQRPERPEGLNPEDVKLGGADLLTRDPNTMGKKALTRPRGNTVGNSAPTASGVKV